MLVGRSENGIGPGPVDRNLKFYYNPYCTFGEVVEWFKALVLKTSEANHLRGFESHPLRHRKKADQNGLLNFFIPTLLYAVPDS